MKNPLNNVLSFLLSVILIGYSSLSFTEPTTQTIVDENSILSQATNLKRQVLELSLKAYNHAANLGIAKKHILTIIDYSKPSVANRFWVIDLDNNKVLFNTLVAHGKGSGENYARFFSDRPRSEASSIGVFTTGDTYIGKHGYSLRLIGLEKGFNDAALERAVVIHKASYVSESTAKQLGRLGRSWGCPALSDQVYKPVIDAIRDGSIIFAYYPSHNWLASSGFLA